MTSTKRRTTVGLMIVLACSGCSATPAVSGSTLTSGTNIAQGRRTPVDNLNLNDRVFQIVDFTWTDPTADGGWHDCEWRWFRDGQLVSQSPEKQIHFRSTPFTLHAGRPTAPLGVGHFTVETIVDGKVVATNAFTITG